MCNRCAMLRLRVMLECMARIKLIFSSRACCVMFRICSCVCILSYGLPNTCVIPFHTSYVTHSSSWLHSPCTILHQGCAINAYWKPMYWNLWLTIDAWIQEWNNEPFPCAEQDKSHSKLKSTALRRPLATEARVRVRVNPCEIYGGQSGTRTPFFSEFFGLPLSVSFHRNSLYSYHLNNMSASGSSSET
jgi:hypothetical protein